MSPLRILVTGSREWTDRYTIEVALRKAWLDHQDGIDRETVVVHGAARGADTCADVSARYMGLQVERHPVSREDWKQFGRSAGHRRNAEMVATKPDVVLAFIKDGSRGATHCADLAEKAGIPVRRYLQRGDA